MWYNKRKSIVFVVLLFMGGLCGQEKYATKGTVTEAVFILQNKHRELLEYIQSLKKKLTDCFAQKKQLEAACCQAKTAKEVEINQCAFYQKVFPDYIKELEDIAVLSLERIQELSKDEPVPADALKSDVDCSFLIKEKIELESVVIRLFLELSKQEWELENKVKRKKVGSHVQSLTVRKQKRDITLLKRKLKAKKEALTKINMVLYKNKTDRLEKTLLKSIE